MSRSPIEMMIDKACGIVYGTTPADNIEIQYDEAAAKALGEVGDAAVEWFLARSEGRMTEEVEQKLCMSSEKLYLLGWQ